MAVRIKLAEGARMPTRATEDSVGLDLCALEDTWVPAGEIAVVPTGVSVELPRGFEAQVRPRSGLTRAGVLVHLGTIDSDYRGEIGVAVSLAPWAGAHAFDRGSPSGWGRYVLRGDRIAQLVIAPVWMGSPVQVEELSETGRGDGGWGSTGR